MDRLTKREKAKLSDGKEIVICNHTELDCNDSCMSMQPCKWYEKVQEKLKAYEDAEEQGLLLRLQVKPGDTIYQPIGKDINDYKVIGLYYNMAEKEWLYELAIQIGVDWFKTSCSMDCIGKTVFLTKEEAEQKLASMKGV